MPAPERIDWEATEGVKMLRGPLSKRAASAEFNEWNARDVVSYIDALAAEKERLEREREHAWSKVAEADGNSGRMLADNLALAARVRSLEEALRRIADWSFHDINEEGPNAANAMVNLAQEALSTREEGKT